eukprot:912740_1
MGADASSNESTVSMEPPHSVVVSNTNTHAKPIIQKPQTENNKSNLCDFITGCSVTVLMCSGDCGNTSVKLFHKNGMPRSWRSRVGGVSHSEQTPITIREFLATYRMYLKDFLIYIIGLAETMLDKADNNAKNQMVKWVLQMIKEWKFIDDPQQVISFKTKCSSRIT